MEQARLFKEEILRQFEEDRHYTRACECLDEGFEDAFQYAVVGPAHARLRSTNLLERLNQEVGRRENLYIISQAQEKESVKKLKQVGADKTISVNEIGGKRMSTLITHPTIISFLDVVTRFGDVEVNLEEIYITEESSMINLSLREAEIPKKTGLIILAVRKRGEKEMIFNPGSDYVIEPHDLLVVMGMNDQILRLRALV